MYSAVYIGYNIGHRKVVILNQCMESEGGGGGGHSCTEWLPTANGRVEYKR